MCNFLSQRLILRNVRSLNEMLKQQIIFKSTLQNPNKQHSQKMQTLNTWRPFKQTLEPSKYHSNTSTQSSFHSPQSSAVSVEPFAVDVPEILSPHSQVKSCQRCQSVGMLWICRQCFGVHYCQACFNTVHAASKLCSHKKQSLRNQLGKGKDNNTSELSYKLYRQGIRPKNKENEVNKKKVVHKQNDSQQISRQNLLKKQMLSLSLQEYSLLIQNNWASKQKQITNRFKKLEEDLKLKLAEEMHQLESKRSEIRQQISQINQCFKVQNSIEVQNNNIEKYLHLISKLKDRVKIPRNSENETSKSQLSKIDELTMLDFSRNEKKSFTACLTTTRVNRPSADPNSFNSPCSEKGLIKVKRWVRDGNASGSGNQHKGDAVNKAKSAGELPTFLQKKNKICEGLTSRLK